jgi:CheY-like chemotaxis protein
MPRKNGRRALEEIKNNPDLCHIPIMILTTSKDPVDIQYCYELGAAGFVTKPATFKDLLKTIRTIDRYWFKTVSLPGSEKNDK